MTYIRSGCLRQTYDVTSDLNRFTFWVNEFTSDPNRFTFRVNEFTSNPNQFTSC